MARYRWGFETIENGNPIFTECEPLIENSTSLDFSQQTNEMFYRAKLNGTLTFRFDTFDYILNAGYNAEHYIVLQYFDTNTNDWAEMWRGRFVLTDCEIDYDKHLINVQPETQDRYTAVLDALDKEYNLVKLKVKMQPVTIIVRPCLQVYMYGATKLSNYIGGNGWEAECEAPEMTDLTSVYKFEEVRNVLWCSFVYKTGANAGKRALYVGRFNLIVGTGTILFDMDGKIYNADGTTIDDTVQCQFIILPITYQREITIISSEGVVAFLSYDKNAALDNYDSYSEGANVEDSYVRWDKFYTRVVCSSDAADVTIGGTTYTLYDIPNPDMAGSNLNYNKIMQVNAAEIYPTIATSEEPTGWPQDSNDLYFEKPANTPTRHYFAVGIEDWQSVAYWWYSGAINSAIETALKDTRTIKDSYVLANTVLRLMFKAGWNGQYWISRAFGGNNDYVGEPFVPIITPRSNVISSYYDTPAQNAPISLAKIFNMLKSAYRCYWFIDENNNIHVEHISYFENGYNYTPDEPELLVDLESELHTRTLNNKVFGQNKVKFDKQEMPQQYTFGWGDKQTAAFDGYPINCLDNYVQKGQISEQTSADFDTDIDYILSSPNDVSKDGFVLFACPKNNGVIDYSLNVENLTIKDEAGDTFEVSVQNADAAFVKIHESWWRYGMPCENINVNNEDTVALSTGNYKLQSVEIADISMAEILKNVSNCVKIIRTQQGNGHIKTISINLNSLEAKADLLFNFIGRRYYLRGTALQGTLTITLNGETISIEVGADNKFRIGYGEPITSLSFIGTDIVSVTFADTDSLAGLTSCDNLFKNCAELIAVDFGNKNFGAVTSAIDMFAGCSQLLSLICPDTDAWRPDIDFTDCPLLTAESYDTLITNFLYTYGSGVHTITPNTSGWNGFAPETQADLIAKATAKGWTIAIPAQYSITGTSTASTVYATINGSAVEIQVTGGSWSYDYNAAITSIAFINDTNVTTIDFSASDGLASLTSLNDAFKGCSALTAVVFTDCDLSGVVSASDCFAGCAALVNLTIPSGIWQPDVDFSDSPAIDNTEMLDIIGGLYTYTSGTHTITFNQTTWDSLTQAQQQTIFDAAQLKYWTTNAVMVVYVIRGTSNNVNGTETFNIQFIDDGALSPSISETITCAVDAQGDWKYEYRGKKIYSISRFAENNTTILSVDFSQSCKLDSCVYGSRAFYSCTNIVNIDMSGCRMDNLIDGSYMFFSCNNLETLSLPNATFASVTDARHMFQGYNKLLTIDMPNATFASVTAADEMFYYCGAVGFSLSLSNATFASVTSAQSMFRNVKNITFGNATFASVTNAFGMFQYAENISLPNATFASVTNAKSMFFHYKGSTIPNITSANIATARQMFNYTDINSAVTINNSFANTTDIWGFISSATFTSLSMPNATFNSVTNWQYFAQDCKKMITLSMPNATFASVSTGGNEFTNCNVLENLTMGEGATLPKSVSFSFSPLTYDSMLSVAKTAKDLTGQTAQSVTFKTSAWNALTAAEQANIQGILQGKNWNLATA